MAGFSPWDRRSAQPDDPTTLNEQRQGTGGVGMPPTGRRHASVGPRTVIAWRQLLTTEFESGIPHSLRSFENPDPRQACLAAVVISRWIGAPMGSTLPQEPASATS